MSEIGGEVKADVTMDGDKIAKIDAEPQRDQRHLRQSLVRADPGGIIEKQSVDVDAVGRDQDLEALIAAVKDALAQVK